jgi:hypothetical protein
VAILSPTGLQIVARCCSVLLCFLLGGCIHIGGAEGSTDGAANTVAPIQTDKRVYRLRDVDPGALWLLIGASYTNRTGEPVYVARCGRQPPLILFGKAHQ